MLWVMELSNAAARTRRDIVTAAVRCWSQDSSASLAEIARHAGVGRTTLNRYFPTREDLLGEVGELARRELVVALQEAELGRGTGLAAVLRAAEALFGISDILGLIFTDNAVVDPDAWDEATEPDQTTASASLAAGSDSSGPGAAGRDSDVTAAIERGHADGSIDAQLPVEWVETFLWTTLFAAHLSLTGGEARHRVALWLERSLSRALALH